MLTQTVPDAISSGLKNACMSRFFIVKVLYGPFLVGALSPICLIRPKDTAKIVLEVCFLSDLETQMLIQAWIFLEASLA